MDAHHRRARRVGREIGHTGGPRWKHDGADQLGTDEQTLRRGLAEGWSAGGDDPALG
jgi:hypothetical protein